MSTAEATYAAALPFPKRRLEWLAGRLAAKRAVQAYYQRHFGTAIASRDIVVATIQAGPRAGKPVVDAGVEIGITHSGDFAVGVCTAGPVGIDLEQNRMLPPLLVRALSPPAEAESARHRTRLDTMAPTLQWACREAVLKYFGFGLRVDPREIELLRWHDDGSFSWKAGPRIHKMATPLRWPRRTLAVDAVGYSLALVL
ncbi:4'-phosphopantetheinyl transferase family protein [Nocardia fluminea]|uniref:4'-phosphopantetheinyl transferase family protein n=1 Tax=Nocardia fluminea TaxID=134984 RepID=UPI0037F38B9C